LYNSEPTLSKKNGVVVLFFPLLSKSLIGPIVLSLQIQQRHANTIDPRNRDDDDKSRGKKKKKKASPLYKKMPNPAATTANRLPAASTLNAPAAAPLDVLLDAPPLDVSVPVALALPMAELAAVPEAAVEVLLATMRVVVP
jgi:hypothetical protein